jgi:hypothetical protein
MIIRPDMVLSHFIKHAPVKDFTQRGEDVEYR